MVHGLIFFSTLAGGISAGVSRPTSVEEIWFCLHLILNGGDNVIYSIVTCVLGGEILEQGNFGAYVGLEYCLCSSAIGSVF